MKSLKAWAVLMVFVFAAGIVSASTTGIMRGQQAGKEATGDDGLRKIEEAQKAAIQNVFDKKAKPATGEAKKAIDAFFADKAWQTEGSKEKALADRYKQGQIQVKVAQPADMKIDGKTYNVLPIVEKGQVIAVLLNNDLVTDWVKNKDIAKGVTLAPGAMSELVNHESDLTKSHEQNMVEGSALTGVNLATGQSYQVRDANGTSLKQPNLINKEARQVYVLDTKKALGDVKLKGKVQVVSSAAEIKDANAVVVALNSEAFNSLGANVNAFLVDGFTSEIEAMQKEGIVYEAVMLAGLLYSNATSDLVIEAFSKAGVKGVTAQQIEKARTSKDKTVLAALALPAANLKSMEVLRSQLEDILDVLGKL